VIETLFVLWTKVRTDRRIPTIRSVEIGVIEFLSVY